MSASASSRLRRRYPKSLQHKKKKENHTLIEKIGREEVRETTVADRSRDESPGSAGVDKNNGEGPPVAREDERFRFWGGELCGIFREIERTS